MGHHHPQGSYNKAHVHPNSVWSGVYYVQAPEGAGDIEFIDPRTENVMAPLKYAPNRQRPASCWTKVTFTPKAGKLLIFPSWLYHAVSPNLTSAQGDAAERIIISFNLQQVRRPDRARDGAAAPQASQAIPA